MYKTMLTFLSENTLLAIVNSAYNISYSIFSKIIKIFLSRINMSHNVTTLTKNLITLK